MADGEHTLSVTLDDDELSRLIVAATLAGVPLETRARELLLESLGDDHASVSRRRLAEYDRTGNSLSVAEALAHFDQELHARTAKGL